MDTLTYQHAKDLRYKMDAMHHQIQTIKALKSFSSTVPEHADTTATLKALLLQDLSRQLSKLEEAFSKL